jgi:hypothetical protein
LYQLVRRHRVRAIVEVGLSSTLRSERLIRLARRCSPSHEIRYAGIDRFDARPADLPRLTLKQTHQRLSRSGATVRLIPGDVSSGLSRYANQLQGTQMLILSADQDPETLARSWIYVPRMLTEDALVLQAVTQQAGQRPSYHQIGLVQIDELVRRTQRTRRMAA